MNSMNRRSALALSLAGMSAVVVTKSVAAQPYAPTQGREMAPGVRQVDLTKRESMIPSYKTVSMRDVVYQPNAKSSNPAMANDTVCHCLEGELKVNQGPGKISSPRKATCGAATRGSQRTMRIPAAASRSCG